MTATFNIPEHDPRGFKILQLICDWHAAGMLTDDDFVRVFTDSLTVIAR